MAISAIQNDEVFLEGTYLSVGVSANGFFGTTGGVPDGQGFHPLSKDFPNQLGLSIDQDGFDQGDDPTTGDFFLPGNPVEGFAVGYKTDSASGVENSFSNYKHSLGSIVDITTEAVSNISSGSTLTSQWSGNTGAVDDSLSVEQVVSFDEDDHFFATTITLTNETDQTMYDVRYARSFDPDMDADLHNNHFTSNEVVNQGGDGDNVAIVKATGAISGVPVFYYSADENARVVHDTRATDATDLGVIRDVFDAELYENAPAAGSQTNSFGGIALTFAFDELAPGESVTFTFYTSLDANIEDSINNIESALNVDLTEIDEDEVDNAGDSVLALFGGEAIAVTQVDDSHGDWQYSLDDGATWLSFSADSGAVVDMADAAVLLDLSAKVRFVPDADWNGDADFSYRVWNGDGGASGDRVDTSTAGDIFSDNTASATLTVNPLADKPVADGVTVQQVLEDAASLQGDVSQFVSDVDGDLKNNGYLLTTNIPANSGTLAFNNDGTYTFVPGDDFQFLAEGQTTSLQFEFTASDVSGQDSDPISVTIKVTGSNDGPVAVADTGAVDADSHVFLNVLANDSDVDDGAVLSLDSAVVQGGAGSATILSDQLVFSTDGDFDHLGVGEVQTVLIDYTVTDQHGATDLSTAAVDVMATAQGEVVDIAGAYMASAGQNTGTAMQFDLDVSGFQTLTFDWEFTTSETNSAFNDVAYVSINGLVFMLTSVAGLNGASSSGLQTFTFTLPEVVNVEGEYEIAIGILNDTDNLARSDISIQNLRLDDETLFDVSQTGLQTGSSIVQWSGVGEGYMTPEQIVMSSGDTALPTDPYYGTAPVVSFDAVPYAEFIDHMGVDTESASIVVDVLRNDNNDAQSLNLVLENVVVLGVDSGMAFIGENKLLYVPGSDFDYLQEGETETVTVTYDVRNGDVVSSAEVVFTINGTNDKPIAELANLDIDRDERSISGQASATDVDGTVDASGYKLVNDVQEGTLHFYADGFYRFTPNGEFDDLAIGDTRDVTFTYVATDNNGAESEPVTVTITVTGTNHGPEAVDDAGNVEEGGVLALDVLANDTDFDAGHSLTLDHVELQGTAGSVSIVDNQLVFAAGSDFDHLGVGQEATVFVDYIISDEYGVTSTATAAIVVTGAAQDEVINLAAHGDNGRMDNTGSVMSFMLSGEAGQTFTFDWLFSSDEILDSINDHAYVSINGVAYPLDSVIDLAAGQSGSGLQQFSFTLPESGDYDIAIGVVNYQDDYYASNLSMQNIHLDDELLIQADADGLSLADSVAGWATRGEGFIDGTEVLISSGDFGDMPVDPGFDEAPIYRFEAVEYDTFVHYMGVDTENAVTVIDVLRNDNNADGNLPLQLENVAVADGSGSVKVVNNQLVFNPGDEYDYLAAGETEVVTVTYDVRNAGVVDSAQVEITITGTDDAPVAAGPDNLSSENTDTLSEAEHNFGNGSDYYAQSFAATGSQLDNLKFAMSSAGASGQFQIYIIETEVYDDGERPVVFTSVPLTLVESADPTVYTVSTAGLNMVKGKTYAVVFDLSELTGLDSEEFLVISDEDLDPTGRLYTLDEGTDNVAADLVDEDWVIHPEYDIGLQLNYLSGAQEDGPSIHGQVGANDHDGSINPLGYSLVETVEEGLLSFAIDGSYSFNTNGQFQDLAVGETRSVTFAFTASDHNGVVSAPAEVTIEVTGTNDAPVANSVSANTLEFAPLLLDVLANDTEVDSLDQLTLVDVEILGGVGGQVSIVDNKLRFDPNGDFDALDAGISTEVTVRYSVTDGHSAAVTAEAVITVSGVSAAEGGVNHIEHAMVDSTLLPSDSIDLGWIENSDENVPVVPLTEGFLIDETISLADVIDMGANANTVLPLLDQDGEPEEVSSAQQALDYGLSEAVVFELPVQDDSVLFA